ncbi:MAG: EAL domain-containing protein [Oscillospiraceae bacterium]|nr:EAL domain-containing protein [Oscillospiraceae bacterium]
MLKSHEKFHSANGKRLILVADDEFVNRELLGIILENDYEVIYAADGQETLDQVYSHRDELSLLLLDLMMPVKPGMEVLRELKADPALKNLPVIVLTADQSAEVESLSLGAIDYIPKPYPQAGIIQARILRAIELSEDRDIIQSTERDPLTGLYNREYFYRYAEQFDQHHKELEMDAMVVDINHFHMINERFGTSYGDEVLRRIGERIREVVADTGGIVCRREADTFLVYCPHGKDYKAILDNATIGLAGDEAVNSRVRLRLGVYANADKTLDVERRFDRAKIAADMVRNSFTKTIGIYDRTMHERELYAEQLIDDFQQAIQEKQFKVYYQPKFDIRPKVAALCGAEALVRWQHPERGLISPGIFIPLFEDNGLIRELDHFVWSETARQIREWKECLGFSIPVSVNVSRVDMYDPALPEKLEQILRENELEPSKLILEITESAYTQDSEQIIETVNRLREMGFKIEMDDFGTGYSSLNMISTLPIDALKLDMMFVRSAFQDQQDTRMLEVIIDIADHLSVPVIAEGVETEEQMVALKDLGCDIAQGYYFSKPLPAAEFEPFLTLRRDLHPEALKPEQKPLAEEPAAPAAATPKERRAVRLSITNYIFVALAILIVAALAVSDIMINRGYRQMEEASSRYLLAENSANDLEAGSDYLTESVRLFVVTGDLQHLENFFEEANVTKRRDKALENLEELLEGNESGAYGSLSTALDYSNELMELEYHAMRLTQLAFGYPDESVPAKVSAVVLSPGELALSPDRQKAAAEALAFGDSYNAYKERIRESVSQCADQLIETSRQQVLATRNNMSRFLLLQSILLVILVAAVLGEVIFIMTQIWIPLTQMVELMREEKEVPSAGAAELRFVTQTYNDFLRESQRANRKLSYEASHDPLTGLLNRSGYDLFMGMADQEHLALMIADVDEFKSINDTYGHDTGDRILKRVADVLMQSFRSVDAVCRLGGDEFAIVMTRANSSMRQLVLNKIAHTNELLQTPEDGLPPVSLSVGVAFSDRENPSGDLFKDADTALYRVKQSGRCGCAVYGFDSDR